MNIEQAKVAIEKQMSMMKDMVYEQKFKTRQVELRFKIMSQVMVCEVEGHDWKVHSHVGELTSLYEVKLRCGNCCCWVDLHNHPSPKMQPIIIAVDGNTILKEGWEDVEPQLQTLTSFLRGEEE